MAERKAIKLERSTPDKDPVDDNDGGSAGGENDDGDDDADDDDDYHAHDYELSIKSWGWWCR